MSFCAATRRADKLRGMSAKTRLTLFHSVIGPAMTLGGLALASRVSDREPVLALGLVLGALVLPVLVVSRVAWASGYAAGRRDSERPAS
jgi:uncharacterized membrane protein